MHQKTRGKVYGNRHSHSPFLCPLLLPHFHLPNIRQLNMREIDTGRDKRGGIRRSQFNESGRKAERKTGPLHHLLQRGLENTWKRCQGGHPRNFGRTLHLQHLQGLTPSLALSSHPVSTSLRHPFLLSFSPPQPITPITAPSTPPSLSNNPLGLQIPSRDDRHRHSTRTH